MQSTLKTGQTFEGIGLHSGRHVVMRLLPGDPDTGIRFQRLDVTGAPLIAATWQNVQPSELCTTIANSDGVAVATIEHIMAAMAGCGVHNALIQMDGPEVPILDGSAAPFVDAILRGGLVEQAAPVHAIRVIRPVEVAQNGAWALLEPCDTLEMALEIQFADDAIGHQRKHLELVNGAFVRELCDSRTFCRQGDVVAMQARGLALGGSLENSVVVNGADVLSPGGLRHRDEAVRHKMLDALGDLALAGAPLLARYRGNRPGHAVTIALLRALLSDPRNVERVRVDTALAARLPGAGVRQSDMPCLA